MNITMRIGQQTNILYDKPEQPKNNIVLNTIIPQKLQLWFYWIEGILPKQYKNKRTYI